MIDLQYHDIRPGKGLYYKLEESDAVERLVTDDEIAKAIYDPPKDTRAYFRGMCLQRYSDEIVSACWDSVIFDLKEGPLKKIFMLEPLRGTEAHVRQLFDRIADRRRPLRTERLGKPQRRLLGCSMTESAGSRPFHDYSTSSFVELLRRAVAAPAARPRRGRAGRGQRARGAARHHGAGPALPRRRDHGRRPAGHAGYQVASRRIEKIFKSDDLSGVGIAGAAGPAMEMAKLFQTELEHYEKVEGENLSLDGKANKLGQMIRMNLPAAMQGLAVVPIFAGFDEKAGVGRLFKYDITGGRYEETDYDAQGSGSKDARDSLKKRWRRDMTRDEALRVALEALIDAADEDVGTGGPDLMRGIFPVGEDHHALGASRTRPRTRSGASARPSSTTAPTPGNGDYRCRCPTTSVPEQMMKDKAEYARKGISRGRSIVTLEYRDGILLVAENPSTLLHKISEIYDRIAFAGVGKYNEFENLRIAGIRHADVKGYSYSRGDVTAKALANAYSQALGNIFTQDIKPFEVEVLVAEVGDANGAKNEIYHILYDGTIEDEQNYAAMGGQSDEIRRFLKDHYQESLDVAAACSWASAP